MDSKQILSGHAAHIILLRRSTAVDVRVDDVL